MSKDPYFEREAQKYENPIASREHILDLIAKKEAPVKREDLAAELNLQTEEALEGLRRRLRAMERDGQLVYTRRKCYALPERFNIVKGVVIGHRDGYGFLNVEGQRTDLFIPPDEMKKVIHGDEILAQPVATDKKGRQEVRVVRIITPKSSQIVGRYFTDEGLGFVVPDDSRYNFDIMIPKDDIMGARMGAVVVVELVKRPERRIQAVGRIVEVLGDQMGTSVAVEVALRTFEIPSVWPASVESQAASFPDVVSEKSKEGREDIRHLPLVTIDGEDARDFDDAVYCEKKRGGGWRLWVAIADVSYYVRPRSAIDRQANERGNSVYFPTRVVPMLPEVLSNGLCSLNPQVDRLCMVCEMTVSSKGRLSGFRFYEAVMSSHARLTYTKVAQILKGDEEQRERYKELVPHLDDLYALYQALADERDLRGAIGFESEEAKFIFNAEQRIDRIEPEVRNDAHKIIEECMILANIAAARFVEKAEEPALYRIHDRPADESLLSLRSVLAELGIEFHGGDEPEPMDYAKLMDEIADRPDHEMLQTMILRSMKQAIYDPENRGHFGLALRSYAHFTSPIRRYPDLLLHRAIKGLLAKEEGKKDNGAWHYSMDEMLVLGAHCSTTERRADDATRYVEDWLKCDYMLDHVGEEFDGIITTVVAFGFFVRLNDLFIDGLVHVSSLDNDYYQFDNIGQRLIGESSGQVYRLGDKVRIKVEAVHMDERKIDFSVISSERGPRTPGKTAKTKAKKAQKKGDNRSRDDEFGYRSKRGKKASETGGSHKASYGKNKKAKSSRKKR